MFIQTVFFKTRFSNDKHGNGFTYGFKDVQVL